MGYFRSKRRKVKKATNSATMKRVDKLMKAIVLRIERYPHFVALMMLFFHLIHAGIGKHVDLLG